MLDDLKYIDSIDTHGALVHAGLQVKQLLHSFNIDKGVFYGSDIQKVVFSGMGGSSLAAELATTYPSIKVPFVINKGYQLPEWVDNNTLVICASYSGNTEETVQSLDIAMQKKATIAVMAHGGRLLEYAKQEKLLNVVLPESPQPRTGVFYAYRALIELLLEAGLIDGSVINELSDVASGLELAVKSWQPTVEQDRNEAKQLAQHMAGKTPIIYGGPLTFPAAYKWKISINENAKNTAWCNRYPEVNHNEFIGWSSHPIEKPFAVLDLISNFEHPRIIERFNLSDKILSGKRPKAKSITAEGDTILEQLLYLVLLGDFSSTYLAIVNGVNPTPVELVEKFKRELS